MHKPDEVDQQKLGIGDVSGTIASPMARSPRTPVSPEGQISLFVSKETPEAFRKAVQIIHSKPKQPLTLLQRKLGNAWAKNSIENAPDADGWWVLRLRDLERDVGFDSNNRAYLKESAEALMRIVFEWDVIATASGPNKRQWKASVMFPEVEIRSDVIRYQVSRELRDLFMRPDVYAVLDMNIMRRFRRASSLAIWEFCARFEKIGHTAQVKWTEFRDMILGESPDTSTYSAFKYFKNRVLNPAIAEVNSESNLTISLVETKEGRTVTTIQFKIERKASADEVIDDAVAIELVGEMVKLKVMQSEARRICREKDVQLIKSTIEYTKRRMSDKRAEKLDNPAAYFRHALQHGYAAGTPTAGVATSAGPVAKVDVREAYLSAQLGEAEQYFKELDPPDQTQLIERYNAQAGPALKLKKSSSKAAEAAFRRWLAADTWGEPSPSDLLEFAQRLLAAKL